MKRLIIIKYGELTTKKDNINFFIKTLKKNIDGVLEGINYSIKYDTGRMFIFSDNLEQILQKLKYVFGIHEIIIGYELSTIDFDEIKNNLLELIQNISINTFKVITKRTNKKYHLTSPQISSSLGAVILKNKKGVKVDVHNPSTNINIEIRNDKSYIYFEQISGLHGYPVGVAGKGLLMLSGGIDSPVAGYLALKRGVRIEAIYFESPPHTSEAAKEKVKTLAKKLSEYSIYVKLHIIHFTDIQESILKNVPHEYLITIMRRMMYRIAEIIAKRNNCKVIINGESIGQVASQTLDSMNAINNVVTIPVIRPVACLDKLEIIEISKNIGTYETSILPYEDCCTIFVPDHPVINPKVYLCEEYEKNFDFNKLINDAIKTEEVITIKPSDKNFEDLL